MSLKGKCAVVTGSTSGIGLGIAQALAAQGANIVMNGFGPADEIEKLRAGIESKHGVKAIYNGADMTRPAEIAALIDAAVKAFGGIGVLVNNAGIQHVAAIEDFPEDKWNAIIAINLSAAFHGTKFAIPHMRKAKWGRIINIASAHGLVASPQKVAYVAAKHGIVGLTKVAGIELANSGVTCNAICPGWVLTPLVQKQIEDRAKATNTTVEQQTIALVSEKQPSHKFSTPEQIGGLAVFLCSPAADNITGTEIAIDGGWTAH
jgi:3-hydroxybutyrate dehydrogenase